ncbi:MAG: type VII secretion protein EccCa [Propionibacteriaceae bacterium]
MSVSNVRTEETGVPQLPTGLLTIQPPPDRTAAAGPGNLLATLIPMMGSVGVMVFMAMSNGQNPQMMIAGGAMAGAMLLMVGFNIYRQVGGHRQAVNTTRREYLAYLAEMRDTVRTAARMQRRHTSWRLPDPGSLVLVAEEGSRLWEREQGAADLLAVRIGTSTQDLSMDLESPELPPLADPDAVCLSALNRFLVTHATVDNMPFGVPLGALSHIEVAGNPEDACAEVRSMAVHAAVFVPPTLLKIAVLCSEAARSRWEWIKWLPHARSSEESDALGAARLLATNMADLTDLLGEDVTTRDGFSPRDDGTAWPHVLLIVDDFAVPANTRLGSREGTKGVTVITMPTSWGALTSPSTLRLLLRPGVGGERGQIEAILLDSAPVVGVPDALSIEQAEATARRLAPWSETERPEADSPAGRSDPKRAVDLMELLDIGDIRDFDPERQWARRMGRDRLRVPFAVTPEGIPVTLDIKESAEQGVGPHGLLIGATGSGKSEVLRTLTLALALTHSPEQLNFVLVDFKGGATFAGMADLPHVSAMISNLESELSLVDRMQDALRGEMVRRQELLRSAGNYANVSDYEADRIAGKHQSPPLPALFIVLDEFSELLSAKPDFIDTFVAVGRLGRSMWIHLLLASQRLEEGRLRGLDSHLSYRVGLKTFSASESRTVLGVPDAFELPPFPGVGYLKAGTESMTRFRASYVAAPPPARRHSAASAQRAGAPAAPIRVLPFTSLPQLDLDDAASVLPVDSGPFVMPGDERWSDMSELDIAVQRMKGKGTPAHQVWLPPLDVPETLDRLMPDVAVDPRLGLVSAAWRERGPLRVPVGIKDLPLEQRRELLELDFSGAGGNLTIIGGPLTGKSTALRTLVMSLSLTNTPDEVQFYIMDFGGGTFASFEGAEHIAGVATRDHPDTVFRMVAELEGIIADRERYFRANRIDSMTTYREGRAQGRFNDGYGDVFLIIDGWASVRADFEDLEARLQALIARSLTFGVHVVLSSGRWMDLRQPIRDVMGNRLELRLGDPSESELARGTNSAIARRVPEKRPGRGIDVGMHDVLWALPRADGDQNPATLAAGVSTTLEKIAKSWPGRPGPKLRLLPTQITLDELHTAAPEATGLMLGIEESRLGALTFDPAQESHLYLLGDAKSGKSSFLRAFSRELRRAYTADQAQLFVVDFRRALLGEVPEEYLAGYLTTREQADDEISGLAEFLATRRPGNDVTPDQLRDRSWWKGAEAWVLVDDYDMVATNAGNPLAPLQPLMAQAQDIGLHIIVTRRSGGASRGMYEPILQTMTELGSSGVLLSGNPDEGALIGRVKPMKSPPGRAQYVTRETGRVVAQLAWAPPQQ